MTSRDRLVATAEGIRLKAIERGVGWRRWGPYLSDRQWGTVREDYSADGEAWNHFTHELARSRAYRWGEDAIAGFSDSNQRWCLGLSLWNGRDRILKERLFGLTNGEGNHGEDVKEHYYHLDGLPSHAYMAMLYRYPHAAYPYERLVAENARRGYADREYELQDTGIFADDRFFDVTVEYAKAIPDDVLMRVTVENRGPTQEPIWLIPQFWGRNTWSWVAGRPRARIRPEPGGGLLATRPQVMPLALDCDGADEIVFCENDSNLPRLYDVVARGPFKDGFHDYIIGADAAAISRSGGSKCAFIRRAVLAPGQRLTMRLRLRPKEIASRPAFEDFDELFERRIADTDAFYAALQEGQSDAEAALVQRRAFAGLLWTKQFYLVDMPKWIAGDPAIAATPAARSQPRLGARQQRRHHRDARQVGISLVRRLGLGLPRHRLPADRSRLRQGSAHPADAPNWYMHPNGQLPAYEWNFGDVNPPVHAWAAWRIYEAGRNADGKGDRPFLEGMFHKLLINFTWWINRKDADGRNIFQGRLPRPRQHRPVRSFQAAADRRQPRPVRRYGVDGDVCAHHAAHRARTRRRQPDLSGSRHQVLRAFPHHRRRDDRRRGRRHRLVERGRWFFLRCSQVP